MKLSKLKPAHNFKVEKWLTEKLKLNTYQKDILRNDELVRFAPFYFYEEKQTEKISFLWRLTFFILPVYLLLMYIFLPIKMLITGEWGYGRKFLDSFHNPWMNKLKL